MNTSGTAPQPHPDALKADAATPPLLYTAGRAGTAEFMDTSSTQASTDLSKEADKAGKLQPSKKDVTQDSTAALTIASALVQLLFASALESLATTSLQWSTEAMNTSGTAPQPHPDALNCVWMVWGKLGQLARVLEGMASNTVMEHMQCAASSLPGVVDTQEPTAAAN